MTAILGISAFYHDSAAALLVDGRIVAAAQEERFSRKKHDEGFPQQAVDYCLSAAGLSPGQLDFVGFYDKPLTKFERLLETHLAYAPRGYRSFHRALPLWLRERLYLERTIDDGLRDQFRGRYVFTEHHESHAASAFFPSPFDQAAILTCDGAGEWTTTAWGVGEGNRIRLDHEIHFPHSLGLLYSAFTSYCGFRVNSGEYKLMGLAPYGTPRYRDLIRQRLIDIKPDGSYRLNMSYFNYAAGLTMTSPRFHELFGGPPRQPEGPLTDREMDLAASIQEVTSDVLMRMARHIHDQTRQKHLVLAGGVALNCVAMGKLAREGPFERIWIQPAAGDAGGALGVALFIQHQLLGMTRIVADGDSQQASLLGPNYTDQEISTALARANEPFVTYDSDNALCDAVADLLAQGKVVAWFQGQMEFGPRALGSRSILADARDPAMQSRMNHKIKLRESFRPFAPIVLAERAHEWFELSPGEESPYMLLTSHILAEHRLPLTTEQQAARGLARLADARSTIPAVTHVDYSARVQTVDRARHPLLHKLLTHFDAHTGCPILVNTSFNVRGEPIVCSPDDALRCFRATHIDVLVLGRHVIRREATSQPSDDELRRHAARFPPD